MGREKDFADVVYMAVKACTDAGIPIAAAAGNKGEEQFWLPARWKNVMSVGAVNMSYIRYQGGITGESAHSAKLNIFAPGVGVEGLGNWSDSAFEVYTGTSQATAHVSGVMATIMGYEGFKKLAKVSDVYDRITLNQIEAVFADADMVKRGTPVHLLQSGYGNPKRDPRHPYYGFDKDELKRSEGAELEAEPRSEDNWKRQEDDTYYDNTAYLLPTATIRGR